MGQGIHRFVGMVNLIGTLLLPPIIVIVICKLLYWDQFSYTLKLELKKD